MAEYISRDDTVDKLNRLCDRVCQYSKRQRKVMCGACPLGDAFTVIEDDIPAADVRPVVRGKWKIQGGGFVKCTSCMTLMFNADTPHEWNFCPNCGAMMEES